MKLTSLSVLLIPWLALAACSADPDVRRGQGTGALVGGVATGLITESWGGAAVGAAAGGLIGGEIARNR